MSTGGAPQQDAGHGSSDLANVHFTCAVSSPAPAPPTPAVSDYGFWVNVALSAATLSVTCVAVVVGVAAFLGFQGLRKLAREESKKFAAKAVDAYLKSEDFKIRIKSAAEDAVQDKIKDKILVGSGTTRVESPDSTDRTEL